MSTLLKSRECKKLNTTVHLPEEPLHFVSFALHLLVCNSVKSKIRYRHDGCWSWLFISHGKGGRHYHVTFRYGYGR